MRSSLRTKWDHLYNGVEATYRRYAYTKKAKLRLKRMNGGYSCDEEYEKIVVPYWEKYGLKPKKMWYQLYWERTHVADPRYIPDDLWFGTIVPYFSNPQFRRFGEDKCMHGVWFKDVNRPATIAMNVAGVYYGPNYELLTKEEAVKACLCNRNILVKPSIDSGEGRLITFFKKEEVTEEAIRTVFDKMGANFIVQEEVRQHPVLAAMNESSLNTVRVVSLFFENEVHILSTVLRVGAKGSKVDNVGAGGYAIVIQRNGELEERGVNRKAEWCSETVDGVAFKGVKVPAFDEILDIVKEQHKKLAHFKIVGWDFSVTEDGEPIFIEFNTCPGQNQYTEGPTFGDLTDRVLDEVFINKTLAKSSN